MKPFDAIIAELREMEKGLFARGLARELPPAPGPWPLAGDRDFVMVKDTALELGNPRVGSASFVLWTPDLSLVSDNRITLAGPDVSEAKTDILPLGKVILAGVSGVSEDKAPDLSRDLDAVRYGLSLEGCMMRTASLNMREWLRISREARDNGFSLAHMAGALFTGFRALPFVERVEVLFVTESSELVAKLYDLSRKSARIGAAMRKMSKEMALDCSECEYQDVCDDVSELSGMREKLLQQKDENAEGKS
ncbi:MAG: hypothetical protein KKA60_04205 [Proteobacteria bacterium]|nr:hypothetical protein [Pseudomonadota bacterium]